MAAAWKPPETYKALGLPLGPKEFVGKANSLVSSVERAGVFGGEERRDGEEGCSLL